MTKAEKQKIIKRARELRKLLAKFGLRLSGFDPGVTAYGEARSAIGTEGSGWAGEPYSFNAPTWAWLKPLLLELCELRKGKRAREV